MSDSATIPEKQDPLDQPWTGSRAQRKAWALKKELERQARSIAARSRQVPDKPELRGTAPEPYQPSPATRIPSLNENRGACTVVPPKPYARFVVQR